MNQSDRTIPYAIAGLGVLALLILLGWLALREPSTPTNEQPAKAVSAMPRERHDVMPPFPPADEPRSEESVSLDSEMVETNAAAIYRQAFALYEALSNEQKDMLRDWRTNVDASVEAELCAKIRPMCDLMHQAAAVSNCDWGVEQPITSATLLPYLSPCRNMARTAIWSVAHCRTGDPSAAVDDLADGSRLGQNVSSSTLIGHLVDLAIQGMVIDSVTEHASLLVSAGDAHLVELLNGRNYDEGLRRGFEQQADMLTREIGKLAALPPEEAMRELVTVGDHDSTASSQIQSMGLAQAIVDMRQAAELRRQYAQALGLPEAEYRAWLASLDEAGKTNPFVGLFVTPLEKAVNKTQTMTVMSAMAVAGLALMQGGPDALQSHPDPTTGQPFAYTQTANGFALESSFPFLGKPMKLSFK